MDSVGCSPLLWLQSVGLWGFLVVQLLISFLLMTPTVHSPLTSEWQANPVDSILSSYFVGISISSAEESMGVQREIALIPAGIFMSGMTYG